jgi:hypothetical protein
MGLRLAKVSLLACFAAVLPALAADPWTIADFNGDRRPDLITATASRNLGGGYTYQLNIGLSFASSYSRIRLSARDVDGDHDADLVVLGAFSQQPIDLWLNDGAGNFHHGDVSNIPVDTATASLEGCEPDTDPSFTAPDERYSLSPSLVTMWERAGAVGAVLAPAPHNPLTSHHPTVRGRAPPR